MSNRPPLTHIIYVDDEPDLRILAQIVLESVAGMTVTLCDSGISALETLAAGKPQLLLLDVMMPAMDGPALFEKIKADPGLSDLPVIFLTGKAQPDEIQRLKNMGAIGVISKPFNPAILAGQIKEIWESV